MSAVQYLLVFGLVFAMLSGLHIAGVSPLGIAPPGFDTSTQGFQFHTWEGTGANLGDELLDSIRYVSGDTVVEKAVSQAQIQKWKASFQCVRDMRYRLFFTTGGTFPSVPFHTWHPDQAARGVGWIVIKADVFGGLPFSSGYIKATFEIKLNDFCGTFNTDLGWGVVAEDYAYLKSGTGEVNWNQDGYQVGDEAIADYKVGWARSAKLVNPDPSEGWTLTIYSGAQDRTVHSEILPGPDPNGNVDISQGSVSYIVSEADFKPTTSCSSQGGRNYLEVTIFNNLVATDYDASTTTDSKALSPPKPSLNTDKAKYTIGDPLVIYISGQSNSQTGKPLCGAHLTAKYSGPDVVLVDRDLSLDSDNEVQYIINQVPDRGYIEISAWVWDSDGRPSEVNTITVHAVDPDDPEDQIPIIFYIVLTISGVLALVMLIPYMEFIPFIGPFRLYISSALASIAFYIVFLLWIWPALLDWWISVKPPFL